MIMLFATGLLTVRVELPVAYLTTGIDMEASSLPISPLHHIVYL